MCKQQQQQQHDDNDGGGDEEYQMGLNKRAEENIQVSAQKRSHIIILLIHRTATSI
jgi:hypothetical protein